ncbi:hypothetical protein FFLO_04563 [Filobasidium floriforme]|uniref:Uncharacterized protein n=1 Tax=Filobasidium floriforme TaxID=5210 RepID=A0A8K0JIG5_9TREE|nr:hypothetical protein FFLO_04563 [Filobasidium floriforme]
MPVPGLIGAFAKVYTSNFERRPVPTLMITNGALNSIGDAVAQTSQILLARPSVPHPDTLEFQPPAPTYDPYRTLRFAAFGVAIGPLVGVWMKFLERKIPLKVPGGSTGVQTAKRVFMDQFVLSLSQLALFVAAMGYMEGRDTNGVKDKFSDRLSAALIANWKVWPLVQAVNFRLMPLPFITQFQSTCGIAWTVYLSVLNARDDIRLDKPTTA